MRHKEFKDRYGVNTFDNPNLFSKAKIVMLAIFPNEIQKIIPMIKDSLAEDALIVSAVYGLTISELENNFPGRPVVRVVTNPFVISGAGTCAYTTGSVKSTDVESIAQIVLSALGKIIKVDTEQELEILHDVVIAETMLSFYSIEAMIEGSIRAGLSLDKSREIVTQVIAGALKTITQPDDFTKHFTDNVEELENNVPLFQKGKEIIDKYNMWGLMKESYEAAQEYLNALGRTKVNMDKTGATNSVKASCEFLLKNP